MTRPDQARHAPAIEPPPALPVPLAAGDVHADWCPVCKAYTVLTGTTLLLTSGGVSTVGTWQWCEVCDDPTDQQEPARG
ncbi:hypothetical protein OHA04_45710 (plasmid) [Streptomyces sp. NBC_01590]|uniref:hypothetical protein n=1 Tax=Streptomyces sp. NBC_01590 TaxID=2975887 RepID=UPI002F90CE87